jgi:large subunit ribosomal protein L15
MFALKRKTENKKGKLVGRGSKRGKTSGRGTKGQKSRAGHSIRPEIRDMIKKYPKLRGRGKNSFKAFRATPVTINVGVIAKAFTKGESVTPATLLEKNVIRRKKGVLPAVKILAGGEITHSVEVYDCQITLAAKTKIEAAGGIVK